MTTIAVTSFKGGTAKTSSTLHLGAALASRFKQRVLLVDFDAQANLTAGLGFDPDTHDSLASVLQGEKRIEEVLLHTEIPGVDLIPADSWLERVEVTGALASDRYSHERLKEILSGLPYDYILIDTPPSLSWLTESALIASSHALVCATAEFYSVKGLERLNQFLTQIHSRHPLNVLGVVLSFWNARGKNNATFLEVIERIFPDKLFDTKVRRDSAVMEASIHGKPVFETNQRARAADDYITLTQEIVKRLHEQSSIDSRKKVAKLEPV